MHRLRGFTLIELMIAVAIIAIVSAFAIPAYNGYVRESRLGAMRMNLDTLRIAVEAFRLDSRNGNYGPTASYTTVTAISNQYGWKPEGDNAVYTYTVNATSAATPTYWIRATGNGLFARCDKTTTTFRCCGDTGAGGSACP
jgi:type IV pilus assembly protein PilE